MIVRARPDGLHLITQPDHARLARRIMEHCVPLATRPRREAILRAIAAHDDGWADEDAAPALDPATGQVVDFVSVPIAVRQRVWPRAIARLADDPWAAAMVAQHAVTAYARFRDEPDWRPFFADMEAARDTMRRQSGMGIEDLAADYAFVRLGDLISLAFCTGWTDEQRFGEWTIQLSGSRVSVRPDVFGGAPVPIEIAARAIGRRRFHSDADLRDALRDADAARLEGEVAGTPGGEPPR